MQPINLYDLFMNLNSEVLGHWAFSAYYTPCRSILLVYANKYSRKFRSLGMRNICESLHFGNISLLQVTISISFSENSDRKIFNKNLGVHRSPDVFYTVNHSDIAPPQLISHPSKKKFPEISVASHKIIRNSLCQQIGDMTKKFQSDLQLHRNTLNSDGHYQVYRVLWSLDPAINFQISNPLTKEFTYVNLYGTVDKTQVAIS